MSEHFSTNQNSGAQGTSEQNGNLRPHLPYFYEPTENPNYMDWEPHNTSVHVGPPQIHQLPPPTPPSRSTINQKHTRKSIIRTVTDDDDDDPEFLHVTPGPGRNGGLINTYTESYGPTANPFNASVDIDADAAYAMKLQQEEYARETFHYPRRRSNSPFPFPSRAEAATGETGASAGATAMSDAEYAAMLQAEEDRRSNRRRSPPYYRSRIPEAPRPSQPSSSNNAETNSDPPLRPPNPPTDSDSDNDASSNSYQRHRDFFEMITRHGASEIHGFPPFFRFMPGRGGRRNRDISQTEDDFGPEDYERLLELDNNIKKKTLSSAQIDRIPTEKFQANSNQVKEDMICSICLENYVENDKLRRFSCKHAFHQPCADRWLKENNICPVCREIPVPISSNSHSRHPGTNQHNRSGRHPPQSNNRQQHDYRQNPFRRRMNNNDHSS